MNVKEASERWNEKERNIRTWCRQGMIPGADKQGRRWEIPDTAEKPPCTGKMAASILENIVEIQQGKNVVVFPKPMRENSSQIIRYLEEYAFISKGEHSDGYQNISLTERGKHLITAVREKPKRNYSAEVEVNLEDHLGGKLSLNASLKTYQEGIHED